MMLEILTMKLQCNYSGLRAHHRYKFYGYVTRHLGRQTY